MEGMWFLGRWMALRQTACKCARSDQRVRGCKRSCLCLNHSLRLLCYQTLCNLSITSEHLSVKGFNSNITLHQYLVDQAELTSNRIHRLLWRNSQGLLYVCYHCHRDDDFVSLAATVMAIAKGIALMPKPSAEGWLLPCLGEGGEARPCWY